MIKIAIDSQYYRGQFDDWFAAGRVECGNKTCYWLAENSNCGFGWDITPTCEDDWDDFDETQLKTIFEYIQRICCDFSPKELILPQEVNTYLNKNIFEDNINETKKANS